MRSLPTSGIVLNPCVCYPNARTIFGPDTSISLFRATTDGEPTTMVDSTRKVCLITGGTSGIGAAAALEIARRGMTVVIVGRSVRRCMKQLNKIRWSVPGAHVDFLIGDLSSQKEVRRLAAEFLARHPRLDVLVNNAGAYFKRREVSVDGIEMNLALNHMEGVPWRKNRGGFFDRTQERQN